MKPRRFGAVDQRLIDAGLIKTIEWFMNKKSIKI